MRYLLIDLSYFVFFRYYAIVSYLKISKILVDESNFKMDEDFVSKFTILFEKCLLTLLKNHFDIKRKKFVNITVIFAKDCSRNDIWRTSIYPEYKATRDLNRRTNDLFDSKIFEYVYNNILPNLIKKYDFIKVCSCCHAEADDIIAIISSYLNEEEQFNNEKTIIITNDNDYLQLLDLVDGIYNLQGKNISSKSVQGCARKNMLYKVLVGDPSDNIKGIISKKKANTLLSMYDNVNDIEQEFLYRIASKKQIEYFNRNKKLICFSHIPETIRQSVKNNIYNQTFMSSST